MKKTNFISHRDWERMAARLEASYDATLDFYVMLANSLGKSHPCTRKSLTVYSKLVCLKADMRNLAKENASNLFEQKELDSLFPDTDTREWDKHFKK